MAASALRIRNGVLALLVVFVMILSAGLMTTLARSEGVNWTTPVAVSSASDSFGSLDLHLGQKYMYILSMAYSPNSDKPVYLFRSADNGKTWETTIPIQYGFRADPGMCVYNNGADDTILLVSGDSVYKSVDNGDNFALISNLPLPAGALWWRFMDITTSASWSGSQNPTIYVVGSVINYVSWYNGIGPNPLGFTKSTDGGLTWSTPVLINPGDYNIYVPKIMSYESKLYVLFSRNVDTQPNYLYSDLCAVSSSDGGMTWSADSLVLARGLNSDLLWTHSMQYLDNEEALVTIGDYGQWGVPNSNQIGRYGYFHLADMSFEEVGYVQNPDWNIYGGFAGALQKDNTFSVAYIHCDATASINDIYYTSSTNSGLRYPGPSLTVYRGAGVPQATYVFTAPSNGEWKIRIENQNLKSLTLVVYNMSTKSQKPMMTQQIEFGVLGVRPTGTVWSAPIQVQSGISYKIIAKDPDGPKGSFADLFDEFQPIS